MPCAGWTNTSRFWFGREMFHVTSRGLSRVCVISLLLSRISGRKWVAAAVGGRAVSSRSAGDGQRPSGELKRRPGALG